MKYRVVGTNDHDALEADVNEALTEGWRCQGGVAFHTWEDARGDGHVLYAQAMTFNEDQKP